MIETLLLMVFGVAAYGTLGWYMAGRPRRVSAPLLVEDSLTERLREEQAQHEAELREFDRELRPALHQPLPLGHTMTDLWKQVYLDGEASMRYQADLDGSVYGDLDEIRTGVAKRRWHQHAHLYRNG